MQKGREASFTNDLFMAECFVHGAAVPKHYTGDNDIEAWVQSISKKIQRIWKNINFAIKRSSSSSISNTV